MAMATALNLRSFKMPVNDSSVDFCKGGKGQKKSKVVQKTFLDAHLASLNQTVRGLSWHVSTGAPVGAHPLQRVEALERSYKDFTA